MASATAFQLNVAYCDIESQILIQRLNGPLLSALRISIVNLIIRVFVIYIQISVLNTETRRISLFPG